MSDTSDSPETFIVVRDPNDRVIRACDLDAYCEDLRTLGDLLLDPTVAERLRRLAEQLPDLLACRDRDDDSGRLAWLYETHRGLSCGVMDDHMGEPTRFLWQVDGAGMQACMYSPEEAIDRAREELGDAVQDFDENENESV